MRMTRRKLAVALAAPALARTAPAQQTQNAPNDALKRAQERVTGNSKILFLEKVAMTTAPAFQFKA